MSSEFFKVEPVQNYDGAQYPSAYAPDMGDEELEKKVHPLAFLLAMVLVFTLVIGLSGCYLNHEYDPDSPEPDGGTGDGGPDPEPDPECDDDEVRCIDGGTVERCEDETWVSQSCEDYCDDEWGIDAYAVGCDAEASEPCRCEYDIMDGVMAECEPGDVMCTDDDTLAVCEGGWDYTYFSCRELCQEELGSEGYSRGCDAMADDPCQCDYDTLDGGAPYCYPGDVMCIDDETVVICTEDEIIEQNCDERCVELYGESAFSESCDPDAEEPCNCIAASDS